LTVHNLEPAPAILDQQLHHVQTAINVNLSVPHQRGMDDPVGVGGNRSGDKRRQHHERQDQALLNAHIFE